MIMKPVNSSRAFLLCRELLITAVLAALLPSVVLGQETDGASRPGTDATGGGRAIALPADTLPQRLEWGRAENGFEAPPPIPADNPMTEQKVALGRKLFFDPILSEDGTVACASCHQPDHGFASPDPKAIGIGGREGKRNAPSILNRAYGTAFLWDGAATSLEQQALVPIDHPDEFGSIAEAVLTRLRDHETYPQLFAEAFGDASVQGDTVSIERLSKAIACFERTLVYGNTKVDRFRAAEYNALTKEARQGMWIFESAGGCWKCHGGENFTDDEFHNTGVDYGNPDRDLGRMTVTGDEADRHKFKTPSLRGVPLTAPYMHNGSMKTLREVVEFYNKGGSPEDPGLDPDLKPLNLNEREVDHLVAFLEALVQDDTAATPASPDSEEQGD